MLKQIKRVAILVPPAIYIMNRIDKGKPNINLPDKKHIIIVGGGITGLTTSYFLTRNENISVTLLEKNKTTTSEFSGQDQGFIMQDVGLNALKSPKLNSLWRVDGPNCVYTSHIAKEPGCSKFIWHWFKYRYFQNSNATILQQLIEKNIQMIQSPKQVNVLSFKNLTKQNFNLPQEVKKYRENNKNLLELNKQEIIWVNKDVQTIFQQFPKFVKETKQNTGSGINQFNCILKSQTFLFDSQEYCSELLQKLKLKSNFQLKLNSEVSEMHNDKDGNVNSISILGKKGEQIQCDAVVICTGASTARILKQLKVRCPVLPLKSYSFNMPCEYDQVGWVFEEFNITVFPYQPGMVRVMGFGDLAGFDTSFDKRRIRNLLNILAKTMDTEQVMKNANLKAVLSGISPDDLPLVGRLKNYPNVYLNVGHGLRASSLCFTTGQMIERNIQFDEPILKELSPQRFHI